MPVNQAIDKAVQAMDIKKVLAMAITNNVYGILDETMSKENLI